MKKISIITLLLALAAMPLRAQSPIALDLWPDGLPNTNVRDLTETYNDEKHNYKPSIAVYLPEKSKADGRAVVCCPGGGYEILALGHEGNDWAKFFNDRGIALVVLKYRMPNYYAAVPSTDAFEAMRITRSHAKEWNIDVNKIGIMGFSAGGHLATTVATHGIGDAKADFQILFYPVVTMDKNYTHMGTHNHLIGENPTPEVENYYSNEKQVRPNDPPAIILLSADDTIVPPLNSTNYFHALRSAGVPATMHIYASGNHGYGIMPSFKWHSQMLNDLGCWLDSMK